MYVSIITSFVILRNNALQPDNIKLLCGDLLVSLITNPAYLNDRSLNSINI